MNYLDIYTFEISYAFSCLSCTKCLLFIFIHVSTNFTQNTSQIVPTDNALYGKHVIKQRAPTSVACHFVMVSTKICLQIPWPNFKKLQQTLLDIIYFSLKVENGNVIKIKKKQKNVEFILRYYVIGLHMYCSFQRSIKTWMNSLHCTMNVLFYIVSMHCTQIQP